MARFLTALCVLLFWGCYECPPPSCARQCLDHEACIDNSEDPNGCAIYECVAISGTDPDSAVIDSAAPAPDAVPDARAQDSASPVPDQGSIPDAAPVSLDRGGAADAAPVSLDRGGAEDAAPPDLDRGGAADAAAPDLDRGGADDAAAPDLDRGRAADAAAPDLGGADDAAAPDLGGAADAAAPDLGGAADAAAPDLGGVVDAAAPDLGPPIDAAPPPTFEETIARILRARGVPQMTADFDEAETRTQAEEFGDQVTFEAALNAALRSYLEDGSEPDSPLALLEFTDGPPCEAGTPEDRVRCFLDHPTTTVALVGARGFPAEQGESIVENWVITLGIPRLSDHLHWAIVDRTGVTPAYNYGFN